MGLRQVRKIPTPPTGIRFPDRPVCSEALYRLSYPGSKARIVSYNECAVSRCCKARRTAASALPSTVAHHTSTVLRICSSVFNAPPLHSDRLTFTGETNKTDTIQHSHQTAQEIHLSWNHVAHYRIHKSPATLPHPGATWIYSIPPSSATPR